MSVANCLLPSQRVAHATEDRAISANDPGDLVCGVPRVVS
jgi:hypothetical protein